MFILTAGIKTQEKRRNTDHHKRNFKIVKSQAKKLG